MHGASTADGTATSVPQSSGDATAPSRKLFAVAKAVAISTGGKAISDSKASGGLLTTGGIFIS